MGKTGSSADLYDILGVAKDASAQDIKKAFRVLARECHPDVAGNDPKMADKFTKVREAYEVLSDPAQRARYDRRGERRASPFYGNMWNRGTVNVGAPPPAAAGKGGRAGNDLDLEDIFNDFGVGDFGFTGQTRGQPGAPAGGSRAKQGPPPETGRFTGRPAGASRANGHGAGGTSASGGSGAGPSGSGGAGGRADARGGDTSGFGFGGVRVDGGQMGGGAHGGAHGNAHGGGGGAREATDRPRRPGPQPGRDIALAVDVPPEIAARGGTVTVTYTRLRRADDGHTLYRYDELHDLKVPPGMRHGDTLRVPGMGDAGLEGGRYGELIADVRVVGGRAKATDERGAAWDPETEGAAADPTGGPGGAEATGAAWDRPRDDAAGGAAGAAGRRDPGRMKMPSRDEPTDGVLRVDVGVVEALLGGRVLVETPGGAVRVNIPAGTSSGTRMRLRGRGPVGADGVATDLVAEVRIVVPKALDEESRRLIERFAELNRRG